MNASVPLDKLVEKAAAAVADKITEPGDPDRVLDIVAMADIPAKPIFPLWPGVLYKGKLTLLGGLPNDGKSLASCDLAARISAGMPWPVGGGKFTAAAVLMITAEDDPGDTIRPRLEVAGAVIESVHWVRGATVKDPATGKKHLDVVRLLEDLPGLEQRIVRMKAALVTVDPLASFTSRGDTNKTGDMRQLMDALASMAARTGCAILIITHMNKRSDASRAMQMIAGSHVLVAAVRVALVTGRDPEDKARRLMMGVKINIDRDDGGFAFRIEVRKHAVCGEVPLAMWEVERVMDLTADEVVIDSTARAQGAKERLGEDCEWVKKKLAGGFPVSAKEMQAEAQAAGISKQRLKKACKAVGAVIRPTNTKPPSWFYRLGIPEDAPL